MALTLTPGSLIVASAYPDPPFDLIENGSASGFDIELMRAICAQLGLALQPVRYSGGDFNGIFDGLAKGSYDAVISGTTITPERSAIALFSQPYLEFNQGVAVNRRSTPKVASLGDLRGLTAGIQSGNTSDFVAKRLLADEDLDPFLHPFNNNVITKGNTKKSDNRADRHKIKGATNIKGPQKKINAMRFEYNKC